MISFQDYLEAKIGVDDRGRNREVYAAFAQAVAALGRVRMLEVGSGTGAMIRHLLEEPLEAEVDLTALDRDAASIAVARERLLAAPAPGWTRRRSCEPIVFARTAATLSVRFACGDILEGAGGLAGPFDVVMAGSLMDLVPLERTLGVLRLLLRPAGLLYAAFTYDGRTTLVPAAADPAFEEELLALYDRSMDERRVSGAATGGSRAGSRLVAALGAAGFELAGCGASDWSLYPFGGAYRTGDALFLEALLETMRAEGLRQRLDPALLDRWAGARKADLRARRLGLIVHQLDLLAGRA